MIYFALFVRLWTKVFFVLTPFFALSMFLSFTEGSDIKERRRVIAVTSLAVAVTALVLFFAGNQLFSLLGITLDSFRIGAGVLLMLSSVTLVQGRSHTTPEQEGGDVAVVPLAIPITVGPATTGTLIVLGAELTTFYGKLTGCVAVLAAVTTLAGVLMAGFALQHLLGVRGISILSRLTGLILAALAAQMIMTGIMHFLAGA